MTKWFTKRFLTAKQMSEAQTETTKEICFLAFSYSKTHGNYGQSDKNMSTRVFPYWLNRRKNSPTFRQKQVAIGNMRFSLKRFLRERQKLKNFPKGFCFVWKFPDCVSMLWGCPAHCTDPGRNLLSVITKHLIPRSQQLSFVIFQF